MKIGIITSGNDALTLFRFLERYDHEYVIYYDFLNRSYGDKSFEYSLEQIKKGIGILIKKGCEKIIVAPVYELALKKEKNILPLFQTYLKDYCFGNSLVGKIGIFGDHADLQEGQKLIQEEAKHFTPAEKQKSTKKFAFPFAYRAKETGLRKYYLNTLSYSEPMVNAVIKHDLRYFKDAGIDTAIPLNYGYFNYQNTISKFFNHKKTRFHKIETLEEIFAGAKIPTSKKYSVSVCYTDHCESLLRNKKILWLLQRGKQIEIDFEKMK